MTNKYRLKNQGTKTDLIAVKMKLIDSYEPRASKLIKLDAQIMKLEARKEKLENEAHSLNEKMAGINGHIARMEEKGADSYKTTKRAGYDCIEFYNEAGQ